MNKIKLFTHNDLDGVGCAILAKINYNNVDVEYCNYDNIDKNVADFLDNEGYNNYDFILITDISISTKLVERINNIYINDKYPLSDMILLLDHHPTALHLNEYASWCLVQVEDDYGEEKCSGTSMVFNTLWENISGLISKNIHDFTELVRQYDTWEWKENNNIQAKQLNDLLYIYGKDRFVEIMVNRLCDNSSEIFSLQDFTILELEEEKKQRYFENKETQIVPYTICNYNACVVFAEKYISELGNYLANKFKEYDFIVLIGDNTISYRCIRDDIDLGLIAKKFGGGGHPKASGSQISREQQDRYIELLFTNG